MKIPKGAVERELFYREIIEKCMISQQDRSTHYTNLRNFYLFGASGEESPTPYNKIYPHVDLLRSFLFSADTTKFTIHTGAEVPELEMSKVPVLSEAVNDDWLASNADEVFGQGIDWSIVYNTMIFKLVTKGGELHPFLVEPQCFGVLREDIPGIDRQEAMVHCYYTTRSQLEDDIHSHPGKNKILENLQPEKRDFQADTTGINRILILASQPNISGNVNIDLNDESRFTPQVGEELIQMQELWIYDSDIHDYRVVTMADSRVVIYDRENIFLKNEVPFVQICTSPLYNYFWGSSEVDRLTGLQRWRNERIAQMRELLKKQADPPKSYNGMGITDEKLDAFGTAGSWLNMGGDAMAKVQEYPPEIPPDLFRELGMIDEMFAEASGLQNLLQGKGESGVRSGRQTSELARLGSARIKKRALSVEDSLEKIATLYLKHKKVYDKTKYKDAKGMTFSAAQFTDSFVVKVDGHSNSPLFVEDHKAMASELLEAHAINRARFVTMLDPPGKEVILTELKEIEKKEAAAAHAQQQAEAAKEQQKHAAPGKK